MITKFNTYNESLRSKMTPKTTKEIELAIKGYDKLGQANLLLTFISNSIENKDLDLLKLVITFIKNNNYFLLQIDKYVKLAERSGDKEIIDLVNQLKTGMNESLRSKMTPKSKFEIDKKIDKAFRKLANLLVVNGHTKNKEEAEEFWYSYYNDIIDALTDGYKARDIYDSYDEIILNTFGYFEEDDEDDYEDEYDTYNQPF